MAQKCQKNCFSERTTYSPRQEIQTYCRNISICIYVILYSIQSYLQYCKIVAFNVKYKQSTLRFGTFYPVFLQPLKERVSPYIGLYFTPLPPPPLLYLPPHSSTSPRRGRTYCERCSSNTDDIAATSSHLAGKFWRQRSSLFVVELFLAYYRCLHLRACRYYSTRILHSATFLFFCCVSIHSGPFRLIPF
jgi:hypothetical protein